MRRIFMMILLLSLLLTACGVEETAPLEGTAELEPQQEEVKETDSEPGAYVRLEIEHEVYDPSVKRYTYFITNGTNETIEFGEDYGLQHWKSGQWQDLKVKSNAGFNAIGYALQPGKSTALTFGFGIFKEKPKAGFYRLVKPIGDETYYAEFELGESPYTEEAPYGFAPLEDLPLDYGAASAGENDVVFTNDGVSNDAAAEEFLYKVKMSVSCQLRTVQDYGEGSPMVIDVIHENDTFLWRMWSDGDVTEKRFSYIVTDGTDLYLSNGADWENTLAYHSDKAFLVPEGTMTWLVPVVEEMMANRMEWNATRYKIWSEDDGEGLWSAALRDGDIPNSSTEFFVEWHSNGGGGRGSSYNLQNWDGLGTAIRKLEWRKDGTLLLTCDTLDGGTSRLIFDPESETLRS